MKFVIKHEIKGRMRIHVSQYRMSYEQADTLLYFLHSNKYVTFAKVYERTGDAVISYVGDRTEMIRTLQQFSYEKVDVPAGVVENSGRELNAKYQEKLIGKIVCRYAGRMFLPYPLRACVTTVKSVKYLWKGLQCLWHRKIEVPVLDATAIGVSIFRNDIETAGSVMFLLGIGELLEEWTHKKSVDDLARTMSLNVGKVWLKRENQEVLVPASEIRPGDEVVVHMGNVIPFVIYSDRTMKVQVNNKEVELIPNSTLTQLTTQLELPVQGIAIAVNNKMIPRTEWERFVLHENDNLVIIKAACGG